MEKIIKFTTHSLQRIAKRGIQKMKLLRQLEMVTGNRQRIIKLYVN